MRLYARLLKYAELDCGKVMGLYVAYMWFKCTVKYFSVSHDEHSLIAYPYQLSYICFPGFEYLLVIIIILIDK